MSFGQTCRGAGCLEKTRKRSIQGRKGGFGLCSLQPGAGAFWTLPECYAHFYTVILCLFVFCREGCVVMSTLASIVPASVLPSTGDLKWVLLRFDLIYEQTLSVVI